MYFNLRKLKLILPFLQGENRENDNVRVNCHLQKNEATSQPVPLNRIRVMREAFQMIQHNVLHLSIHLSLRCCTVCFSSHLPPEKLSTPFYLFVGWFTHKKRKDSYLDENATALPNVDRLFVPHGGTESRCVLFSAIVFAALKHAPNDPTRACTLWNLRSVMDMKPHRSGSARNKCHGSSFEWEF